MPAGISFPAFKAGVTYRSPVSTAPGQVQVRDTSKPHVLPRRPGAGKSGTGRLIVQSATVALNDTKWARLNDALSVVVPVLGCVMR